MYYPFNMENVNMPTYDAYKHYPQSTAPYDNYAFDYWERSLFQRLASVLEFDGLPEEWTEQDGVYDFFIYCLFRYGFLCISEDERGIWFQPCTVGGQNFYRQPTYAMVNNPAWKEVKKIELGTAGALLKLTPDYRGLYDIVTYFAEKLAILDCSVNTSLINSKIPHIVVGKTPTAIQALKKIIDKINRGEPSAFWEAKVTPSKDPNNKAESPFEMIDLFKKDKYITSDLLEDRQRIIDAFDQEIGIKTLPIHKKERMSTAEVSSNNVDSTARINTWLESLNKSLDIINKMFGTNITVKNRYEEQEAIEDANNAISIGNVSEQEE